MSDHIKEYFAVEENCYKDLGQLRKLYNKNTTVEEARNAQKSLHLMYLYCPEDLSSIVLATMDEFGLRMNVLFGYDWEIE